MKILQEMHNKSLSILRTLIETKFKERFRMKNLKYKRKRKQKENNSLKKINKNQVVKRIKQQAKKVSKHKMIF